MEALRKPSFYFGLGLPLAYIPALTGYVVLTGWAFLAVAAPIMLWRKRIEMTPLHWCGLGFMLWAALSIFWTDNGYDGIDQLAKWAILAVTFMVGASSSNSHSAYLGLLIGITIAIGIACAQAFGLDLVWQPETFHSHVTSVYANATVFGAVVALAFVLAWCMGQYWFLPIGIVGLWLSGARWPSVVAVVVSLWFVARHWSKLFAIIILVPGCLFIGAIYLNKNDLGHAGRERAKYVLDTVEALTWQGSGVGSFFQLYPEFTKRVNTLVARPEHPYNDFLEVTFELGIGSLFLWAMLVLALEVPLEPERSVLLAFLLISLAYFPLAIPACAGLAAFVAGRLAWGWAVVRRGERLSRSPIPPWVDEFLYGRFGDSSQGISIQSTYPNSARVSGLEAITIYGDHSNHRQDLAVRPSQSGPNPGTLSS